MSRKKGNTAQSQSETDNFGERLRHVRKARGYTQTELGEAIGVSQRVITYYEREAERPPAHLLAKIGVTLGVAIDELLGLKDVKRAPGSHEGRLWRKLKQAEKLPPADRRTLVKVLDGLLAKNER